MAIYAKLADMDRKLASEHADMQFTYTNSYFLLCIFSFPMKTANEKSVSHSIGMYNMHALGRPGSDLGEGIARLVGTRPPPPGCW